MVQGESVSQCFESKLTLLHIALYKYQSFYVIAQGASASHCFWIGILVDLMTVTLYKYQFLCNSSEKTCLPLFPGWNPNNYIDLTIFYLESPCNSSGAPVSRICWVGIPVHLDVCYFYIKIRVLLGLNPR